MRHRIAARPPAGISISASTDQALIGRFLEDAAHYPGGHATTVVRPRSLDELSACLREPRPALAVGAQSSLTGGATPQGDVVIATELLNTIDRRHDRIHAGAGVTLQAIQAALATSGRWFPPVPTFLGAFAGGAVATCAAGAATFKYGTVRDWVEGLTVVLAGGDILELSRGECVASADGVFEIETSTGVRTIRLPALEMPDVPKKSAGYFIRPGMDLIDLFIGSEGTLGVIAAVTFRTARLPGGLCRAFVPVSTEAAGIALVDELRRQAAATWRTGDPNGIDVSAIEHLDARSIAVLREDGINEKLDIHLPQGTGIVLLIDLELPEEHAAADSWHVIESALDTSAVDSPLTRFCRLLDRHHVLDDAEIALPGERRRAAAFAELREGVPAGVNRRVALAKQLEGGISKTAADMIVPYDRFGEMMTICRQLFADRSLDLAVWGHISDGNVHPNVIPHSADDVRKGRDAILALGDAVIEMGGCPLAEHGVGRSPIKQELLRRLYGQQGVDAMRAIKLSLDPHSTLATGVIFPAQ
ncbi:MAG TPA: FAD-binding oxidoreductase [Vicinamibacterales bacterium]|nr:FAD-binding oxidoreductase [Vicinamibacterales bacterium]